MKWNNDQRRRKNVDKQMIKVIAIASVAIILIALSAIVILNIGSQGNDNLPVTPQPTPTQTAVPTQVPTQVPTTVVPTAKPTYIEPTYVPVPVPTKVVDLTGSSNNNNYVEPPTNNGWTEPPTNNNFVEPPTSNYVPSKKVDLRPNAQYDEPNYDSGTSNGVVDLRPGYDSSGSGSSSNYEDLPDNFIPPPGGW